MRLSAKDRAAADSAGKGTPQISSDSRSYRSAEKPEPGSHSRTVTVFPSDRVTRNASEPMSGDASTDRTGGFPSR